MSAKIKVLEANDDTHIACLSVHLLRGALEKDRTGGYFF